jgi:hypothetical protein
MRNSECLDFGLRIYGQSAWRIGHSAKKSVWTSGAVRLGPLIIEHRVSSIQYRASSIEHPVSSIQYRASSIQYRASSIQYRASSIQHRVSSDRFYFRLTPWQGFHMMEVCYMGTYGFPRRQAGIRVRLGSTTTCGAGGLNFRPRAEKATGRQGS